jgi:hypothetical protein
MTNDTVQRYPWFSLGDINGFFGLMFDNLTVLFFMAGILFFGFGLIHSVLPEGNMYLPWQLTTALQRSVPYQFAAAYLSLALLFLTLSFTKVPGNCSRTIGNIQDDKPVVA